MTSIQLIACIGMVTGFFILLRLSNGSLGILTTQ